MTAALAALAIGIAPGRISWSQGASASTSWNPKAAADYLDQRAAWWIAWPGSARDHGSYCISCHTALPYLLARPVLRSMLHEVGPSDGEGKLLNNVEKRVRLWNDEQAYYDEHFGPNKSVQSRGTESVLNALILASSDERSGRKLGDETRAALQQMWTLQEQSGDQKGSWPWMDFGNEPFEARDSRFWGACLAAIAVGSAPTDVLGLADVRRKTELLREYLKREYPNQSLINQTALVLAAGKLPGILTNQQESSIVNAVLSKQLPDGGWSLADMAWSWKGESLRSMVKFWTGRSILYYRAKATDTLRG